MDAAGCVSAGMGVNAAGTSKVGWGVPVGRAVGGGGSSTGIEQAVRVEIIKAIKSVLSFISHPFNKKTGGGSRQLIVLFVFYSSVIFFAIRLITSATPPIGFFKVSKATSTISGAMRLILRKRRVMKFSSGFGSSSAV